MQRWRGTHVFDQVRLSDDKYLKFGDSQDFTIRWDGTNNRLELSRAANTLTDPGRQIYASFTATGAVASGKSLTGIQISATFNGTGNNGSVTAAEFKARHTTGNAATVVQLRGVVGNADAKNGIVTTAYAVEGSIDVSAGGSVGTSACFHGNLNNSGTVTTSYGVFVEGVSGNNLTKGIFMQYVTTGVGISAATTGIDIGNVTTGITFTGTIGVAITFASTTLTPDSTRSNCALGIGTRATEKDITMAAAATQHLDPIQMNLNIIGANPTGSSTVNGIYQLITHDTTDMTNLRLKCADWNVVIKKDVLDAYVFQGEIDFNASGIAVGNEACVVGLVLDAGANAVTASEGWRGLSITLRGAGTPANSQAILIDGASDITVREGIWIMGGGITAAIRLARVDNYANSPINLLALPPAGYTPVSSHGGIANGGTVVKIACLVGTTPYYLLASTAPA